MRVETGCKHQQVGHFRAQCFQDQQFVVKIAAENTHGLDACHAFFQIDNVMGLSDFPRDAVQVIVLSRADRRVMQIGGRQPDIPLPGRLIIFIFSLFFDDLLIRVETLEIGKGCYFILFITKRFFKCSSQITRSVRILLGNNSDF
ncbi:MAG: hypothetical protein R3E36_11895 [Nitrosomonas sp.]|nr:hypothetical protein [Nitrosomonas sp.]